MQLAAQILRQSLQTAIHSDMHCVISISVNSALMTLRKTHTKVSAAGFFCTIILMISQLSRLLAKRGTSWSSVVLPMRNLSATEFRGFSRVQHPCILSCQMPPGCTMACIATAHLAEQFCQAADSASLCLSGAM